MNRIKPAPVGLSRGVFAQALGPVKKINPRDQSLVKRIPGIIAEIASNVGKEKVCAIISKCPNEQVRECCMRAIGS